MKDKPFPNYLFGALKNTILKQKYGVIMGDTLNYCEENNFDSVGLRHKSEFIGMPILPGTSIQIKLVCDIEDDLCKITYNSMEETSAGVFLQYNGGVIKLFVPFSNIASIVQDIR